VGEETQRYWLQSAVPIQELTLEAPRHYDVYERVVQLNAFLGSGQMAKWG
jgi:hypothetical protein